MCDETFGPTIPVRNVPSEEEAIELVNDSEFSLTGCIWTENLDGKAADQIEAER
jgi:acyl-CoA reductase-like NAD-dependent aldehyde dehydrogenase